jgi:ribosome maturation factor RimP
VDLLSLRIDVRAAIEPTVVRLGFDLVAVEWTGNRVLRLSVDRAGGISGDDCAVVTQNVSPLLDAADPIDGKYTLEVSSPGIDRPVERRDDFRRFQGFRAKVKLGPGAPRRRFTGDLAGVDNDELLIVVDSQTHRLFLDNIEQCHLVLDLEQYEQLGKSVPALPQAEETTP